MYNNRYQHRISVTFVGTLCIIILLQVNLIISRPLPNSSYNSKSTQQQSFDPYHVLGLNNHKGNNNNNNISSKDIKQRYHELCLKYHPDKNHQLSNKKKILYENKFKQIRKAYELIGTVSSRRHYDFMSSQLGSNYNHNNHRNNQQSGKYNDDNDESNVDEVMSTSNRNGNEYYFHRNSNENPYQEMIRRMFEQQQYQSSSSSFMGPTNTFLNPYQGSSNSILSSIAQLSSLKSIYVYKVYIPLQDLYNGIDRYQMNIHQQHQPQKQYNDNNRQYYDYYKNLIISNIIVTNHFFYNIWKRYIAAFRGGIGYIILYQSLLYSLPFYRWSKSTAFAIALYLFDRAIPTIHTTKKHHDDDDKYNNIDHDNDSSYYVNILPGYKGGTKFTFKYNNDNHHNENSMNNKNDNHPNSQFIEIVFQLCEARHKQYKRIGNHLHTSLIITPQQAKDGCVIDIHSLSTSSSRHSSSSDHDNNDDNDDREEEDNDDNIIHVSIPSNTISGDQIVKSGYGWPIRKTKMKSHDINSNIKQKDNRVSLYGDLIVTVHISKIKQWKQRFFP